MGFLIDTSIFIAWERSGRSPLGATEDLADEPVALSAITASELWHGVFRADSEQRRARRTRFVEAVLSQLEVLPFDREVARRHAEIWSDLARAGQVIGAHDLIIAATALTHELTVATGNLREFSRVDGLQVVHW